MTTDRLFPTSDRLGVASGCAKHHFVAGVEVTWGKVLVQEINSCLHCLSHYGTSATNGILALPPLCGDKC